MSRYITYNFLLAPTNITGILTNKIDTKDNDPLELLLYNSINALITLSFIYLVFATFHDKYFGFVLTGVYASVTCLIGLVVGTVDQAFYLRTD